MTMRVLLMPVGSAGDVHPFVGIGLELRRRGHEVTIATNGYFRPLAERVGLRFVELGTAAQFDAVIEDRHIWRPGVRAARVVFSMGARVIREQFALCMEGDWSVVAAGPLAFGARVAQDRRDLPLATVQLAAVFMSVEKPPHLAGLWMPRWHPAWVKRLTWRAVDAVMDMAAAGPINDFRRAVGLPPVRRVFGRWWNSPRCVLAMFPEWYAPPAGDWPANLEQTGFALYDERGATPMPAAVRAFMEDGEKPIAFTGGSANAHVRRYFESSLRACDMLGRRALLITRFAEQLPPLAQLPGVMHVDYAPFSELLPGVAALVHHGGVGTTAQALAAGVPQLVAPLAFDQFDNAQRVRALGVGDVLPGRRYTAERAAARLRKLLSDPVMARQCSAISQRIEPGEGVRRACDALQRLSGDKTPGRAGG